MLTAALALFLVSMSPLPQLLASASGSGATLDSVQVAIQPKNATAATSYDLVAYNSTGYPVATYYGQYPTVTFNLPAGTYLFSATVSGQPSKAPLGCCVCAESGGVSGKGVASPPTPAPPAGGAAIAYPCYYNGSAEYGYSVTVVSGSTDVSIATQPPSSIPTTDVTVSVSYKNGTAAEGAYVSANMVGSGFYWGPNTNAVLDTQTGADGVAHLVVPEAPMIVSASMSIPVVLPKGDTTTQVRVGGELVNVTLSYSPYYVYESATGLLIPPQTSLNLVLSAEESYPPIAYGVSSSSSGAGVASPGAVASTNSTQAVPSQGQSMGAGANNPAQSMPPQAVASIPPIAAGAAGGARASSTLVSSSPNATSASPAGGVTLSDLGIIALAGALAAVTGIVMSRSKH